MNGLCWCQEPTFRVEETRKESPETENLERSESLKLEKNILQDRRSGETSI